jgi:hypothetical protein
MLLLALLLPFYQEEALLHLCFLKSGETARIEAISNQVIFPTPYAFYLVRDGKRFEVQSLKELGKHATITSPACALEFVRVFSSPFTWMLGDPRSPCYAEVMQYGALDPAIAYGDNHFTNELSGNPIFLAGVVAPDIAQALHLSVNTEPTKGGYIVTRLIARKGDNRDADALYWTKEFVSEKGGYRVISRIELKTPLTKKVQFPTSL